MTPVDPNATELQRAIANVEAYLAHRTAIVYAMDLEVILEAARIVVAAPARES